ncbi:MAG TPA: CoA-transferase [Burkholderiales bacterium]|nr:CoA-transferase [Burkholderiales bacterium]
MSTDFLPDAQAIADRIPDGALVAMPPDYSLPAMAVVRALIRKKSRGLRLLGVPVLGMCADLLIGAGCVAEVETSAVSLGEAGLAPRFTEAAESGTLTIRDATCPAIHTALQASEKGVPFMPLGGVIGSDLVKGRKDWKVAAGPFSTEEILYVKAIRPDIALFHVRWLDDAGNAWIGRRRELATIAHASKETLVTFEEKKAGDMLEDELLAPGCLSAIYVSAAAPAAKGAWPLGAPGMYDIDDAHLAAYARAAKTPQGFQSYLKEFVLQA